jgi:hypothetical protein
MGTNPNPNHDSGLHQTQCTVVITDPYRGQVLAAFQPPEPQRRVIRIHSPKTIVLDGKTLNVGR